MTHNFSCKKNSRNSKITKLKQASSKANTKHQNGAGVFTTLRASTVLLCSNFSKHRPFSVFFATIVAFAFSAIFSATSFFTQSAYATTLTLSVSDNITATALPTSASGTTAVSDTTATNISISTDNTTGYTLSLKSSSSSAPALTGSSSNTIPSITTQTATLDSFTSGTWGYKPTKKNGSSWSNLTVKHGSTNYTAGYYLPGPTTTADTIDVTSAANATANEYNIAVGAKVSTSTAIDSYTGSFIVAAVVNLPPITVTYDPQGGNYSGSTANNTMIYSVPETTTYPTVTATGSTTDSTSASGAKKSSIYDSTQYANNANYYQDLTLDTQAPGPYTLTVYYATESVLYDWICVFDGTSYTPGSSDACTDSTAIAPSSNTGGSTSGNKIGGPGSSKTAYAATATFSVTSKTARIYFRSDGSAYSYGFWAKFTGGGTITNQSLISGSYLEPIKTGYIFKGWCDGTITNQNITPTCSGTTYTASTVPGVNSVVSNNTTLSAMWKKENLTFDEVFAAAGKSQTSGYYTMQDMTSSICDAVTTPTTTTQDTSTQLIDTRDSKVYWVSKLLDGECWMTQNLDYDISSSTNVISNIDGTSGTWTSSSTYAPEATSTSVFETYKRYTGTSSYDPGSKYLPGGTGTATNITCTSSSNGGENCHYHLGNYYQWNAATAGTGGTITGTDATASICPTGWRLPTSNSYTANYSFGKLTNAYGITSSSDGSSDSALLVSPLWFVRGGNINWGSLSDQGTYGYFWSSLAWSSSDIQVYYFLFSSSSVKPNYYTLRNDGHSVRCVAE